MSPDVQLLLRPEVNLPSYLGVNKWKSCHLAGEDTRKALGEGARVITLPLPTDSVGESEETCRRQLRFRRQRLGGRHGSHDPHPHNVPLCLEYSDLIQYSKWVPQIQKALHNTQPHLSQELGDCLSFVGDCGRRLLGIEPRAQHVPDNAPSLSPSHSVLLKITFIEGMTR